LLRKKLTYPFLLCIEDEEAAAYVGLRNFIHGLAVDRTQNAKTARYEPSSQAPLLADRKGLQRNTVLRLEVCLVLLDLFGRERDIVD